MYFIWNSDSVFLFKLRDYSLSNNAPVIQQANSQWDHWHLLKRSTPSEACRRWPSRSGWKLSSYYYSLLLNKEEKGMHTSKLYSLNKILWDNSN